MALLCFERQLLSAFASCWARLRGFAQPVIAIGVLWAIRAPFCAVNSLGIVSFVPALQMFVLVVRAE